MIKHGHSSYWKWLLVPRSLAANAGGTSWIGFRGVTRSTGSRWTQKSRKDGRDEHGVVQAGGVEVDTRARHKMNRYRRGK